MTCTIKKNIQSLKLKKYVFLFDKVFNLLDIPKKLSITVSELSKQISRWRSSLSINRFCDLTLYTLDLRKLVQIIIQLPIKSKYILCTDKYLYRLR